MASIERARLDTTHLDLDYFSGQSIATELPSLRTELDTDYFSVPQLPSTGRFVGADLSASCLLVTAVAEGGIAWTEGVRPGAKLVTVNGEAAADFGVERIEKRVEGAHWVFQVDAAEVEFKTESGCTEA